MQDKSSLKITEEQVSRALTLEQLKALHPRQAVLLDKELDRLVEETQQPVSDEAIQQMHKAVVEYLLPAEILELMDINENQQ